MIHFWELLNKNDKLDALRKECAALEAQNKRLDEKLDRVMAYFGLAEKTGPRIEYVRDLPVIVS